MTPINETPNRLDALRGTAEMAGTPPPSPIGNTPPPSPIGNTPPMSPEMLSEVTSDPMIGGNPMMEGMDTGVVPEPTEIVEGFASSVMELTNGSVEGAVSLLQSTIDTLLSSQSEDPAMGQDAGRIEELLGGLPV